jgi:undecaprenyl pyrophosphate phosphatase UppP
MNADAQQNAERGPVIDFPICMVAPLLIADYRSGEFESRSVMFRVLASFIFSLVMSYTAVKGLLDLVSG